MSRTITFTNDELFALRDTASEWCEIMRYGDSESCDCVNERLDNGLGTALRKLYRGLDGEMAYKHYKFKKAGGNNVC